LREDKPVCRTDDFWEAQWKKVAFVSDLQKKYDCVVIHAGDLFHHWKPSPYLLSTAIQYLPDKFHTVYGQHDLPQHNIELANKSGVHTLVTSDRIGLLQGIHFGQTPEGVSTLEWDLTGCHRRMLVWHKLVWTGKKPWPKCLDPQAQDLLDQYFPYDVIITGDNHTSFVVYKGHRALVNPGSLTRQTADQAEYEPCVYLWYVDDNHVKRVDLPIKQDVISREHIDVKAERDKRIEAFVERLTDDWESDVSFEQNLKRFEQKNKIRQSVMGVIRKAMENE